MEFGSGPWPLHMAVPERVGGLQESSGAPSHWDARGGCLSLLTPVTEDLTPSPGSGHLNPAQRLCHQPEVGQMGVGGSSLPGVSRAPVHGRWQRPQKDPQL